MNRLIEDFLREKTFAVCGSFRNTTKYAYQIFNNLIERGHEVFPVNPGLTEVDGRQCYKRISDIPAAVGVVNIVTPPSVTEDILKECLAIGVKKAWLQPGAESKTAIDFCRDNGISVVHGVCVMLETLKNNTAQP